MKELTNYQVDQVSGGALRITSEQFDSTFNYMVTAAALPVVIRVGMISAATAAGPASFASVGAIGVVLPTAYVIKNMASDYFFSESNEANPAKVEL